MNQLNLYRTKSIGELEFIVRDAGEAALAMRGHDEKAECKYLDQVNDACTVLYERRRLGKPQLPKE